MSNLPAYIRQKTTKLAQTALEGVGIGTGPHINIKGNRFALVDAAGNRQPLQTLYCDVVIFDLQAHYSKIMYPDAYDEDNPQPPICWSDNGIGPSSRAEHPQALTCKGCPNDRFGSRISAMGSEVKACRDEWKTACVVPGVARQVFRLTIPPGSLKAFKGYLASFGNESYDVDEVVTRITFADGQNGVLAFQPVGWLNDETAAARDQAAGTGAANALLGRGDAVFAPGASTQIQQHLAQIPPQQINTPNLAIPNGQRIPSSMQAETTRNTYETTIAPQQPGTLPSSAHLQQAISHEPVRQHFVTGMQQPQFPATVFVAPSEQHLAAQQFAASPPPPPPAEVLSPDGNYVWNGGEWRPRQAAPPPPPPRENPNPQFQQALPPGGAPTLSGPTQPPAARKRRTKAEMDAARAQVSAPTQAATPPVAPFRQAATAPSTAASFQPAPPPPPNGSTSSFGIGGGVPPNPDVTQALAGLFPPS